MKKQLELIVLLDDNKATNFLHKKILKESACVEHILEFQSGPEVIDYLDNEENKVPELMFIDINMPIMSAWEFLEEFKGIENLRHKNMVIILLSTSLSPTDAGKASSLNSIKEIRLKPLDDTCIEEIIKKYFTKK